MSDRDDTTIDFDDTQAARAMRACMFRIESLDAQREDLLRKLNAYRLLLLSNGWSQQEIDTWTDISRDPDAPAGLVTPETVDAVMRASKVIAEAKAAAAKATETPRLADRVATVMRDMGDGPHPFGQIFQELMRRSLGPSGQHPNPTVYSVMRRNPDLFEHIAGTNLWHLTAKGMRQPKGGA